MARQFSLMDTLLLVASKRRGLLLAITDMVRSLSRVKPCTKNTLDEALDSIAFRFGVETALVEEMYKEMRK